MYLDRRMHERVEQVLVDPAKLDLYRVAAGHLGMSITILAEGKDEESRRVAGDLHGEYAAEVAAYRAGMQELYSQSPWLDEDDASVQAIVIAPPPDCSEYAAEAYEALGQGQVLVELASPTLQNLTAFSDTVQSSKSVA